MAPITTDAPELHGIIHDPLATAKFTLNAFGVAGFFGGETAVNGMATVIFFFRGRWGGLYNTPGSLEIAKRYGQLASPRLFRGLFPGDTRDPSQLFGLDGKPGPKFLAACSGSLFEKTGHLAHLLARMAKTDGYLPVSKLADAQDTAQRITTPTTVTIIDLTHLGNSKPNKIVHPTLPFPHYGLFALVPIVASIGACIGCALVGDWWSFSSIALGMIANGWACFVLGLGKLTFQHPEPARDAPPGDGILWAADNAVVVVRGSEHAVNAVTRGHFFLHYGKCHHEEDTASHTSRPDTPTTDAAQKGRPAAGPSMQADPPTDELLNPTTDPERSLLSITSDVSESLTPTPDACSSNATPAISPENMTQDESSQPITQDDAPQTTPKDTCSVPTVAGVPDVPTPSVVPATPAVTTDTHLPSAAGDSTVMTDALPNTALAASLSGGTQGMPSCLAVHDGPSSDGQEVPPSHGVASQTVDPSSKPVQQVDEHESRKPDSLFLSISSILLTVQFVAQLLLIPQASVFGQLMFVSTLAVSWGYNIFISSIDSEDVQTRLLHDILELKEKEEAVAEEPKKVVAEEPEEAAAEEPEEEVAEEPEEAHEPKEEPEEEPEEEEGGKTGGRALQIQRKVQKFEFGTWTAMTVFACLALRRDEASPTSTPSSGPKSDSLPPASPDLSKVLNALIPNDTPDWKEWKDLVVQQLPSQQPEMPELSTTASELLKSISSDADAAYRRYSKVFGQK